MRLLHGCTLSHCEQQFHEELHEQKDDGELDKPDNNDKLEAPPDELDEEYGHGHAQPHQGSGLGALARSTPAAPCMVVAGPPVMGRPL